MSSNFLRVCLGKKLCVSVSPWPFLFMVSWLFCLFFPACLMAQVERYPIRIIAGADSVDLSWGRFAIREYLDVYNDDNRVPVTVNRITADTWIGHKKDREGENWLDDGEKPVVAPQSVRRVAERLRIVDGRPKMNWWVRWIRFKIDTSWGSFVSNFTSSPLRPPPGTPELVLPAPKVESLSAPGYPGNIRIPK